VTAADLLAVPGGSITETGLRTNISVGVQYLGAWLGGQGAVPINNLMEDAATAEISRAQVWQWVRHPQGVLADGRKVTLDLVDELLADEMRKIEAAVGPKRVDNYRRAGQLFSELTRNDEFEEFLTLPGYGLLD